MGRQGQQRDSLCKSYVLGVCRLYALYVRHSRDRPVAVLQQAEDGNKVQLLHQQSVACGSGYKAKVTNEQQPTIKLTVCWCDGCELC